MPIEYVNEKPVIKGIPRGSTLCIVSLPDRREVINTKANGSFTPAELDPGKYAYTVQKAPIFNNPHRVWNEKGEFLVDVDEIGYQKLLFIKPRYAKGVMTTSGARWDCGVARCAEQFTSLVSVVKHEGEHLGIDFLKVTPDEAEEALLQAHASKKMLPQESTDNPRTLEQQTVGAPKPKHPVVPAMKPGSAVPEDLMTR